MQVFVTSFWLPKAGNTEEEFEDAFYPVNCGMRKATSFRFALADGASEGMLSGEWAKILVKNYCQLKRSVKPHYVLKNAIRVWESWFQEYIRSRELDNPIQWFEELGFEAGAFSTLLGITLIDDTQAWSGTWEAIAVGDSCLFQVRKGELIEKFPLDHSSDFNNSPFLLSSKSINGNIAEFVSMKTGKWVNEDAFYLMTDALAQWFLREHEKGQSPWCLLSDLGTVDFNTAFPDWIDDLRRDKRIRNDDVTLVRIDIY